MTELQSKLLNMLKWLVTFLDEHNIRYYVVGGTFLGAVRHNGFIPWDDDIDIGIPRSDYQLFLKLIKEVDNQYAFECPKNCGSDYIYCYGKLFDTTTTLVEKQRRPFVRGIFIDVFPLDGLGKEENDAHLFAKKANKKISSYWFKKSAVFRKGRVWYKNVVSFVCKKIAVLIPSKTPEQIDSYCSKNDYESSSFVANLFGRYGEKEVFPKSVFGLGKKYKFESIYVNGPEQYDCYLKQLYGDWKKMPPQSKRNIQHDFILLDLNKSYLESTHND